MKIVGSVRLRLVGMVLAVLIVLTPSPAPAQLSEGIRLAQGLPGGSYPSTNQIVIASQLRLSVQLTQLAIENLQAATSVETVLQARQIGQAGYAQMRLAAGGIRALIQGGGRFPDPLLHFQERSVEQAREHSRAALGAVEGARASDPGGLRLAIAQFQAAIQSIEVALETMP